MTMLTYIDSQFEDHMLQTSGYTISYRTESQVHYNAISELVLLSLLASLLAVGSGGAPTCLVWTIFERSPDSRDCPCSQQMRLSHWGMLVYLWAYRYWLDWLPTRFGIEQLLIAHFGLITTRFDRVGWNIYYSHRGT